VGKKRAELHRPTPTALASDSSAVDELVMRLYRAVNGQGHKLRRLKGARDRAAGHVLGWGAEHSRNMRNLWFVTVDAMPLLGNDLGASAVKTLRPV
jgi:hypothetical protein